MSQTPRHKLGALVSHSEKRQQPSVDLVHMSECEIHGGLTASQTDPKL